MSTRFVLGLGGTVDYEIAWDAAILERLVAEHGIRAAELSTSVPIVSERSLLVTLLAFVRDGLGGERFVASSEIVAVPSSEPRSMFDRPTGIANARACNASTVIAA